MRITRIGLFVFISNVFLLKRAKKDNSVTFCGVNESLIPNNWRVISLCSFLILFQCIGLYEINNIKHHPKDSWWQSREYFSDIGLVGHVYEQGYSLFSNDIVFIRRVIKE